MPLCRAPGECRNGSLPSLPRDDTRDKATERARFNGHTDEVKTVAFAPDGKTLAAAAWDGRILLWTVASGRKVREWQYPGKVDRLAFSPDGRYLVTANGNGTAYVLRLAPPPKPTGK